MNVYFYWGAQQRHPPKIHHPFTQEPQKVHVKERFSLEFIRFLAVLLPLLLPSPRTTIYATQRNPPGPAHHLSMGSIAREDCGRERTIHSFPNKQNHNLFLVSKFSPFFALPDVPRVNVPLRHRFNGKIWPTLFVCSVFLRVVVTPRRSLPCYVFRSPFRTLARSYVCSDFTCSPGHGIVLHYWHMCWCWFVWLSRRLQVYIDGSIDGHNVRDYDHIVAPFYYFTINYTLWTGNSIVRFRP